MLMQAILDPDRQPGSAFHIDDTGFLDFESRSGTDIKAAGAYRYATEADAIIGAYAIGHAPIRYQAVKDFSRPLHWAGMCRTSSARITRAWWPARRSGRRGTRSSTARSGTMPRLGFPRCFRTTSST